MPKLLVALFCMALAIGPAVADDRANLLGIWKLVGDEIEFQDTGERRARNPKGYLIFTREGRMMALIENEGRKAPQTDDDRALLFRTMFAYSGLYRLERDMWVTTVDVAWNPAWIGTEQVRFYKLEGDRLIVNTAWAPSPNPPGRITRVFLTWTRVKLSFFRIIPPGVLPKHSATPAVVVSPSYSVSTRVSQSFLVEGGV